MFQSPDHNNTLSVKLSEVMEDIGVNEKMVMRRRKVHMLSESIQTVSNRSAGNNMTAYYLGSQSEGTTTQGLDSDCDVLCVDNDINVIQDWSEWKLNKHNFLMIQDENVSPGYCFLQRLRSDEPLPATPIPDEHHVRDSNGRILFKNTFINNLREDAVRHGPSNAISGPPEEFCDTDIVYAVPCNSWPLSATRFLERRGIGRWRSSEMIRYAVSHGCFVVGASSKISTYPELEWRISTTLAEKCLMYNLNITQIQCYVLLKIILKTFLNPLKQNNMSSFICKTVLFHCIENTEQSVWRKNNLASCVTYCLLELHHFVQNDNIPHFIVSENNLMAGQFTVETKRDLLSKISDILQSDDRYLLRINIDDIRHRLNDKMNTFPNLVYCVHFPKIREECSCLLYLSLAKGTKYCYLGMILRKSRNVGKLKQVIYNQVKYSVSGNRLEQLASQCTLPLLCSSFGCILASCNIRRNIPLSPEILMWLSLGMDSDVTSGRLKLASAFYSTGNIFRTELILKQIERQYLSDIVSPVCGCWHFPMIRPSAEFERKFSEQSENNIRHMISFCVTFLPNELNCVPRELQYEMMRSTRDDMPYRSYEDRTWMDYAVVDSLPYLYFLQYKTYGHLQRYQDQQNALSNLMVTTITGVNYGHRETAFNLLGQCMEQEGKPREALQCYLLSLEERARNNAAKLHIFMLLANCVSQV